MKLGETGGEEKSRELHVRGRNRRVRHTKRMCVSELVLPGEAEEDVNDDGSQINTLFPVLPQYSGQSTQSCLYTHRHVFMWGDVTGLLILCV